MKSDAILETNENDDVRQEDNFKFAYIKVPFYSDKGHFKVEVASSYLDDENPDDFGVQIRIFGMDKDTAYTRGCTDNGNKGTIIKLRSLDAYNDLIKALLEIPNKINVLKKFNYETGNTSF